MRDPLPATLPAEKRATVAPLVDALAQVPGVSAIVLGGSYASGMAKATSDVDLGLYYRPEAPFAIESIAHIARSVATAPPTVTGFYEWGAWVNGGAWVQTATGKGCLARMAANLTQALFALNRRYFISDKRAMSEIDSFTTRPAAYTQELAAILAAPGNDAATLARTVTAMETLWQQVVALTEGSYRPRFAVP